MENAADQTGRGTMTTKQAHHMLLFHQRMARAFRQEGQERKAMAAEVRAAECRAFLQVERHVESTARRA